MDFSKIDRKYYKMFCLIYKEFLFQKQSAKFYSIFRIIAFVSNKNLGNPDYEKNMWELYSQDPEMKSFLERNQFFVLKKMCEIYSIKEIIDHTYILKSRYAKSFENRKKMFKNEI